MSNKIWNDVKITPIPTDRWVLALVNLPPFDDQTLQYIKVNNKETYYTKEDVKVLHPITQIKFWKEETLPKAIMKDDPFVTHKELAEWLAKGNGQIKYDYNIVSTDFEYRAEIEDAPVDGNKILIRWFNTSKWLKPTKKNMYCLPPERMMGTIKLDK